NKYIQLFHDGMTDFRRLLQYVRPHWLLFTFALIAMVLVAVFETATGARLVPIFGQFMPAAVGNSETLFNLQRYIPQEPWYRAWLAISLLLMSFTILKGIAEFFSSYLMAKIGQAAVLDLRRQLYDHLLSQPAAFFEKHRTNFLVSRLVVSCSAIEMAVSANLRDVLREGFMIVFFFTAAFYFNWRLMLGAMIIAPIIAFLTTKFSKSLRRLAGESFGGNKQLNDTAQETLSNQTIVKAYSAEPREKERFGRIAQVIAKANRRSGRIAATSPPTIEIIGTVAMLILFYFGLREINANRMDAAQFFTFLFFLFRSYDPMRKISRQHNEISKAFAAMKDVWGILDEDDALPEKKDALPLRPLENAIELSNLSFAYENDPKTILDGVSLR